MSASSSTIRIIGLFPPTLYPLQKLLYALFYVVTNALHDFPRPSERVAYRPIVFFGLMRGGAKFIRGTTPHGYDHVGPLYHLVRELNRGLSAYVYALFGHSLYGAFVHYARGAGASALYLDLITSVGLCEAFRHLAPAGISHANEKNFFLARHAVLSELLYHLFIIKAISLARG